ncbi:phosphoadenosine phosphosulfate reductase family protein [Desulfurococcaceae archaeon MEX13E-LK6-19]|nr:phosphoadenosine phosphosulfate reductase family protein [Desulfurococcaceae archaeon MEX13E-LK6-19]
MIVSVHDFMYFIRLDSFMIAFPGCRVGLVGRREFLEWARENTDPVYYQRLVSSLIRGLKESLVIYDRRYSGLDDYIDRHRRELEEIKKRAGSQGVLVLFSGGKDSTVVLLLLEALGIPYKAVFSYLPVLEDLLLEESKKLIKRFSADIAEAPREKILHKLVRGLLPSKIDRWCTRLKHHVLKPYMESYGLRASGLRVYETGSRIKRYRHKHIVPPTHNARRVNPILYMTTADVLHIVVKENLLNPVYSVATRASCTFCPYASSAEITLQLLKSMTQGVETVNEYVRAVEEYMKKIGANGIDPIDYAYMGLWRYSKETAKTIYKARKRIIEECRIETLSLSRAQEIITRSHIEASRGVDKDFVRKIITELENEIKQPQQH